MEMCNRCGLTIEGQHCHVYIVTEDPEAETVIEIWCAACKTKILGGKTFE